MKCLLVKNTNKGQKDGNHPIQLFNAAIARRKLDYIHNNPVADETVCEPGDYLYSSARDYYTNRKGYLDLVMVSDG